MVVARSEDMQLVAYVLARCGAKPHDDGPSSPPDWLPAKTWTEAYDLFFEALGDGRNPESFRNSLKNARDAFDGHVDSGRVGWVDRTGAPYRQDNMVSRILKDWGDRDDDTLREAVGEILAGGCFAREDEDETNARTEGGERLMLIKSYERSARLRREAIRIHGTSCMACGFDFSTAYGSHGLGYIEVHHSMPLADFGKRETDPATDLVVLCANCHRMVHRNRGICLSVEELKTKLNDNQKTSRGTSRGQYRS